MTTSWWRCTRVAQRSARRLDARRSQALAGEQQLRSLEARWYLYKARTLLPLVELPHGWQAWIP